MRVAGCLLNYPRQKADNALVIQECADKSMTDQILSVRSIGDGKPDTIGIGTVERDGCGGKHNKVRRLHIYPCVTIPCGCVEVKGARLRELYTVDSPFCRGITEGGYVCMILPVNNMDKMNRHLFAM